MLIDFSVGNFRSFYEVKTLSMEATAISEFPENLYKEKRTKLLLSAAIYGANSSGKSNFARAMGMMKKIILTSLLHSSTIPLPYDPFLLKTHSVGEPSFFEILFLIDGIKYRYGFELTDQLIVGEWLFETEKIKERPLFIRVGDGIEVMSNFKEGRDLEEKTRGNALFLAVVDQFNGTKAKKIMQWFSKFNIIDGVIHKNYRAITFSMLENKDSRALLTAYYNTLDLGFEAIKIDKKPFDSSQFANLPEDLLKQIITDLEGTTMVRLTSLHKIFDEQNSLVNELRSLNVRTQESSGTNKIIDLSGPIFNTLKEGGVLVIDELDAKLHPLLTLSIIRLFQNPTMNLKNAQLIFTLHSTKILGIGRLRRDQIYFTEKGKTGASDLYSLVEYNMKGKKVRKDNSFEKDYIYGRYGAVPFIRNLEKLEQIWLEK